MEVTYSTPLPGTHKREVRKSINYYAIVRQVIMGDPMRTTLPTPYSTRGKARWAATKHIKNNLK